MLSQDLGPPASVPETLDKELAWEEWLSESMFRTLSTAYYGHLETTDNIGPVFFSRTLCDASAWFLPHTVSKEVVGTPHPLPFHQDVTRDLLFECQEPISIDEK